MPATLPQPSVSVADRPVSVGYCVDTAATPTRVLPESLADTWRKVRAAWPAPAA